MPEMGAYDMGVEHNFHTRVIASRTFLGVRYTFPGGTKEVRGRSILYRWYVTICTT